MIRSEMISFRPEYHRQRNLLQYIQLVEQVFEIIKNSLKAQSQSFNLNSIACAIRQVVLKNDCLEQKDQILDFFFICQKYYQENVQTSQQKNWNKIIEQKINMLKGLQKIQTFKLFSDKKTGINSLKQKYSNDAIVNKTQQFDFNQIQVEQDIKLKTLFFFKWCKFIEYRKSIKRLRLKQIDDLRKSLNFNQYAVKFSYFHNWRRQAKNNVINRKCFQKIQANNKKYTFNRTVNSFYTLFEIKSIEQKLVQKVQVSLKECSKQRFFKKFITNKNIQKAKSTPDINQERLSSILKNNKVQLIKYRFLNYLVGNSKIQPIKSKTLTQNFIKNSKIMSFLCGKLSFQVLKQSIHLTKQNIQKVISYRKASFLEQKFKYFKAYRNASEGYEQFSTYLRQNNIKKVIINLNLNKNIKRGFISLNDQTQCQDFTTAPCPCDEIALNNKDKLICLTNQSSTDLFKYLSYERTKIELKQKLKEIKTCIFLNKIKTTWQNKIQFNKKHHLTNLMFQTQLFSALKLNSHKLAIKKQKITSLNNVYHKNLLKRTFKSLKLYKCIQLSHQEYLQKIQQTIINPNQLMFAFNRIYQRQARIIACQRIFSNLSKFTTRYTFGRCFSTYIKTLNQAKKMQKVTQIKRLRLLFELLKRNQEYGNNKVQEIKTNVILKLSKQRFVNKITQQNDFSNKFSNLYCYNLIQKQTEFIKSLKQRKQNKQNVYKKSQKLQNFLHFSLFQTKTHSYISQTTQQQSKSNQTYKYLITNEFKLFKRIITEQSHYQTQRHTKQSQLQKYLTKNNLTKLLQNCEHIKCHKTSVIQSKLNQVRIFINQKPFYNKFKIQAKQSYLKRWLNWNTKVNVIGKISINRDVNITKRETISILKGYKLSNAWKSFNQSIERENQQILNKQSALSGYLTDNSKHSLPTIVNKIRSIKQVSDSYEYLIKAIKTKYLSKLMRNSLIIKYRKVKEFCAIKSYARNLKAKSLKGLRIMLMRLRDKQNRLKTQQQIIVKVDKAIYQSRKSNKLSETISRFNNMRQSNIIAPR